MRAGGGNGRQYYDGNGHQNRLQKKVAVYFCIVLLITKCMRAEIKEDEKLLIDLEWP